MANPPDLATDWLGHQRWAARAADERTLVENWLGPQPKPERVPMTDAKVRGLVKAYTAAKENGDTERVLELGPAVYRETGRA